MGVWGWGMGDWGLGIGDWAQSPIPHPQSPIPISNFTIYSFALKINKLIKYIKNIINHKILKEKCFILIIDLYSLIISEI